jgi:hypothetical protein
MFAQSRRKSLPDKELRRFFGGAVGSGSTGGFYKSKRGWGSDGRKTTGGSDKKQTQNQRPPLAITQANYFSSDLPQRLALTSS